MMRGFRRRLGAAAYVLGWTVVRRLPGSTARATFRLIADVAWWSRGRGVRQLEANLRRAVGAGTPEARLRELSRAGMRSYCRYWLEVFRLAGTDPETVVSRFHVRGEELLWEALGSGRGVILALPHSGNWDHAGAWLVLSGHRFTTVAERVSPESLYDRFVGFREQLGMEVLPLDRSGDDVYRALADRLQAGGVVCLLADRDLTVNGVDVTFFGEPARMPAGPAALAMDCGAVLLPVTLWFEGETGWGGRVHEEIAVPAYGGRRERIEAMTHEMASVFEAAIAARPQDWHMLQRVWTADLDTARPARKSAAGSSPAARRGGTGR